MINLKLQDGLGNQLFEYAAARSLALRLNTELNIDTSFYDNPGNHTPRPFLLSLFNTAKFSQNNADLGYKTASLLDKIFRHLGFKFSLYLKKYYFNLDNSFDPLFDKLPDGSWLTGSFQNEKYFISHLEALKSEFTFKIEPAKRADIEESEAVFVHIRRGDYLLPQYSNHHSLCSLDYYHKAIESIKERVKEPRFFVFSDDIAWAEENLNIDNAVYVSNPALKDYEEFYLMSRCRHAVIANSTFSWWAASLIANPNKTVIAPQTWFVDTTEFPGLVPDDWLII